MDRTYSIGKDGMAERLARNGLMALTESRSSRVVLSCAKVRKIDVLGRAEYLDRRSEGNWIEFRLNKQG